MVSSSPATRTPLVFVSLPCFVSACISFAALRAPWNRAHDQTCRIKSYGLISFGSTLLHQLEEKNWTFHDLGHEFVCMMCEFSEALEVSSAACDMKGGLLSETAVRGYVGFEIAKVIIYTTAFVALLLCLACFDQANVWSLYPLTLFLSYALSDIIYVHVGRAIRFGITRPNPGLVTALPSAPLIIFTLKTFAAQIRLPRERLFYSVLSILFSGAQGYITYKLVISYTGKKISAGMLVSVLLVIFPVGTAVASSINFSAISRHLRASAP